MKTCNWCGTAWSHTEAAKHRLECVPPNIKDYQEIGQWYWVEKPKTTKNRTDDRDEKPNEKK